MTAMAGTLEVKLAAGITVGNGQGCNFVSELT
jgi:hypothetical protein